MPCVEDMSNITTTTVQPTTTDTENATQSDTTLTFNETFVNESVINVIIGHNSLYTVAISIGLVSVFHMSQDKDCVTTFFLLMTLSLFHSSGKA